MHAGHAASERLKPERRAPAVEAIPAEVFRTSQRLALQHAGMSMGDHKRDVVATRINRRVRALGLEDAAGFLE